MLRRALSENNEWHQSNAQALRDGGHYSQVMPGLNIYYIVYYPASAVRSSLIKLDAENAKKARRTKNL